MRTLIAPTQKTLVRIEGTHATPVTNVTLQNVIFAHSAPTYFEQYIVPSPGDWSVHRGGAVYMRNVRGVTLANCTLARLGGNGVALDGRVVGAQVRWKNGKKEKGPDDPRCLLFYLFFYISCTSSTHTHSVTLRAQILGNDLLLIGGSAIVIVGRVAGADSADAEGVAEFPSLTRIARNLIDGVGVLGKQAAAIFQANALATTIEGNVLFNGPLMILVTVIAPPKSCS